MKLSPPNNQIKTITPRPQIIIPQLKKQESQSEYDKQTVNEDNNINYDMFAKSKSKGYQNQKQIDQYGQQFQHVGSIINKWSSNQITRNEENINSRKNIKSTNNNVKGQLIRADDVKTIEIKSRNSQSDIHKQLPNNQKIIYTQSAQQHFKYHKRKNKTQSNQQQNQLRKSQRSKLSQNSVGQNSLISHNNNQSFQFNQRISNKRLKSNKNVQNINHKSKSQIKRNRISLQEASTKKNANEIVDSRKKAQMSNFAVVKQSRSLNCCENVPIQRILTFVLMYQITVSFLAISGAIQSKYWILVFTLLLILPTYYGYKCVSLHMKQNNNDKMQNEDIQDSVVRNAIRKGNGKVENNFNNPKLMLSQSNSIEGLSIAQMKFSKIQSSHNYDQPNNYNDLSQTIQLTETEQSNKSIHFSPMKNQLFAENPKYLLVVPYLHNNQMQAFTKCAQCTTSYCNSKTKHCKRCHMCHYNYDHYCKWLAVCVDGSNYYYFIRFVALLWLFSFFIIIAAAYQLYQTQFQQNLLIGLSIISLQILFSFVFCTYIFGYHIFIMCRAVTTKQYLESSTYHCNNFSISRTISHSIDNNYYLKFIQQIPRQIYSPQIKRTTSIGEYLQEKQGATESKIFQNQLVYDEEKFIGSTNQIIKMIKIQQQNTENNQKSSACQNQQNSADLGTIGSFIYAKRHDTEQQSHQNLLFKKVEKIKSISKKNELSQKNGIVRVIQNQKSIDIQPKQNNQNQQLASQQISQICQLGTPTRLQ